MLILLWTVLYARGRKRKEEEIRDEDEEAIWRREEWMRWGKVAVRNADKERRIKGGERKPMKLMRRGGKELMSLVRRGLRIEEHQKTRRGRMEKMEKKRRRGKAEEEDEKRRKRSDEGDVSPAELPALFAGEYWLMG